MTTETYRDLPGMPVGWRNKQLNDKANVPFRSDAPARFVGRRWELEQSK